jgi:hypothetical protein
LSHIVVDWTSPLGILQLGSAEAAVGMWGFEIGGLIGASFLPAPAGSDHDSVLQQQVMCRPKGKMRAIVHGFLPRIAER